MEEEVNDQLVIYPAKHPGTKDWLWLHSPAAEQDVSIHAGVLQCLNYCPDERKCAPEGKMLSEKHGLLEQGHWIPNINKHSAPTDCFQSSLFQRTALYVSEIHYLSGLLYFLVSAKM